MQATQIDNRWRARRVIHGLAMLAAKHEKKTRTWVPWHMRNARFYQGLFDATFLIAD